jgi:hypothetical protein
MASTGIEQFQDLNVSGPAEPIGRMKAVIVATLATPWSRDADAEKQLGSSATYKDVLIVRRSRTTDIPAAGLFMFRSDKAWSVGNIVPSEVQSLTKGQYNAVLSEFCDQFVRPAAAQLGLSVKLSADHQSLEDWLPPNAVRALRSFSAAANKSTGSSHPLDQRRWYAFLTQAHGHTKDFDTSRLRQWLVQIEHWPEDVAADLAIEYEFGLGLLDFVENPDA